VGLVRPTAFAGAAAALVAVLGAAGAVTVHRGGGGPFDLDAELTLPALASAALLLCAAAAAGAAGFEDPAPRSWSWAFLAALFTLMAVDEATGLHEQLERSSTVDWQTLYAPLVACAAVVWALCMRRLDWIERLAFAGGALAWGAAQVLEAIEWTGPRESERAVEGYGILMGAEELLEMTGSALFALAALVAARRWERARATADGRSAAGGTA